MENKLLFYIIVYNDVSIHVTVKAFNKILKKHCKIFKSSS